MSAGERGPRLEAEAVALQRGWRLAASVHPDSLLDDLYGEYNRRWFEGLLPPMTVFRAYPKDEDHLGMAGMYFPAERAIYIAADCRRIEVSLIHEMAHVAVPEEDGHGPLFRAQLQRIAEMGTELVNEEAEYEVWRMVGDHAWDDGWLGEESGRWERFREQRRGDSQRQDLFRRQLAAWTAEGRLGVPTFAIVDVDPAPGTCISCGEARATEFRCGRCIDAALLVLSETT